MRSCSERIASTALLFSGLVHESFHAAAFLAPHGSSHSTNTNRSMGVTVAVVSNKLPTTRSSSTPTTLHLGDFFKKSPEQEPETPAPTTTEDNATTNNNNVETWDDDPVEKMFNFFFGKKEAEPMGMARFGPERFPEQYPATKTEWAAPQESDGGNDDMELIRPFLKNTNLESRALRLTYDADRDGWDPYVFHRCVDRRGGAVVLCTTRRGVVCGGYNPKGWVGYGEARGSIAAFLFTTTTNNNKGADRSSPGIKLIKVGGPGLAQMDMPETAVSFGADSLVIPMGEDNPKMARSKLGSYYERFPDGGNSLFGKDAQVQLKNMRVYHGLYEEGEYIPHTDAEPFALY